MTDRLLRSAVLAAAAIWTGPAAAQSILADPSILLADADRDRDGSVTRAEFIAARSRSFGVLDTDRDGRLSVAEVAAVASGSLQRMAVRLSFGQFDQNRDGRLTRRELDAGPTPLFDRVDTDRDGDVSAREFEAWRSGAQQKVSITLGDGLVCNGLVDLPTLSQPVMKAIVSLNPCICPVELPVA